MADPYVSVIVGAETYRDRLKRARLEPVTQSVPIAGPGNLLSGIIPRNVHGALVARVLGIGTLSFAGYAVGIWATPLILVAAATQISRKEVIADSEHPSDVSGVIPDDPPNRRTSI